MFLWQDSIQQQRKFFFQQGAHKRGPSSSPSSTEGSCPWSRGSGCGVLLGLLCPQLLLSNTAHLCIRAEDLSPQVPGVLCCLADVAPGRCPPRTTGILSATGSSTRLRGIMAPGGRPHPLCCSQGRKVSVRVGALLPQTSSLLGRGQEGSRSP